MQAVCGSSGVGSFKSWMGKCEAVVSSDCVAFILCEANNK